MPIPNFQEVMLPTLKLAKDKEEHRLRDVVKHVSDLFNLTDEERDILTPSGSATVIHNRTGWAITYLKKAGLLQSTRWGYFKITERGVAVLKESPFSIDQSFLKQFPEFMEFQKTKAKEELPEVIEPSEEEQTPEESLRDAYQRIQVTLADKLIEKISSCPFQFFERLVAVLLEKMGYGTSEVTGKPRDEGIDGIVWGDRLKLNKIYFQAKRWENKVSRSEIQKFKNDLRDRGAKSGIFVATSAFTSGAKEAAKADVDVRLIEGKELAELMIEYNVGISHVETFTIKRISTPFFGEED